MIFYGIKIFTIFILFLLVMYPSCAMADFLPQMITVQDINGRIAGYINIDGQVMDGNYNMIGYIRQDGRIDGADFFSIGYFDGNRFQDSNFNTIGYMSGNRVDNSNFASIGYVGNGRIEGQDYSLKGYFMGDTGGKDWVVAAFCLYYTNLFRNNITGTPEQDNKQYVQKDYKTFGVIELENGNKITAELYFDTAPSGCLRFITLAKEDFYEGLKFFDVLSGSYVRIGSPNNDVTGKSKYEDLPVETSDRVSIDQPGLLVMYQGISGNEPPNCQFLITMKPLEELKSSNYTVLGKVVHGFDNLKTINPGDAIDNIKIEENVSED